MYIQYMWSDTFSGNYELRGAGDARIFMFNNKYYMAYHADDPRGVPWVEFTHDGPVAGDPFFLPVYHSVVAVGEESLFIHGTPQDKHLSVTGSFLFDTRFRVRRKLPGTWDVRDCIYDKSYNIYIIVYKDVDNYFSSNVAAVDEYGNILWNTVVREHERTIVEGVYALHGSLYILLKSEECREFIFLLHDRKSVVEKKCIVFEQDKNNMRGPYFLSGGTMIFLAENDDNVVQIINVARDMEHIDTYNIQNTDIFWTHVGNIQGDEFTICTSSGQLLVVRSDSSIHPLKRLNHEGLTDALLLGDGTVVITATTEHEDGVGRRVLLARIGSEAFEAMEGGQKKRSGDSS